MRARGFAIGIVLALTMMTASRANAGSILSFTKLSSGTIGFTVTDITSSQLAGSNTPQSFQLHIKTSALAGSITLTAPAISGSSGSIASGAYYAQCTATSDPSGVFSSSGLIQLSSGPVTCANIASNNNAKVSFDVQLYLNCTPGPNAFPADPAYGVGSLSVTANAP